MCCRRTVFLFLWSSWTWQQYQRTFFSVRLQESVQQIQLPRLTAWPLIKTVENEITPQIHHGRCWLSERSGAATHCMFTPGPLGFSALRVFLEPWPDFSNGPRGFFVFFLASFHPCFLMNLSPVPLRLQASWWGWQRLGVTGFHLPPPHTHSSHHIFPTHFASLAFHLLDTNGSHECCDVMHRYTQGTAFPWIFLFSLSSTCSWNLPLNQN